MKSLNVWIGYAIMGVMMITMMGCSPSAERFVNNFGEWVSEIGRNNEKMSAEDWKKADMECVKYMKKYLKDYKGSLTMEQNKVFKNHAERFGFMQFDAINELKDNSIDDATAKYWEDHPDMFEK